MKQSIIFLIIILAFTIFAYLSIYQISSLNQSLLAKPNTILVKPKIDGDISYYVDYKFLNNSKGLESEYLMDSLFVDSYDSTNKNFIKYIEKVVYNIYVFNSEENYEKFQTYTGTRETNFNAKVRYTIRTRGSSSYSDNFVITALIYLKNGDIKIPFPTNY